MRPVIGTLLLTLGAVWLNAISARLEAADCSVITDSARCTAEPNCHFDVNKRGCYEGPRPKEDACVVHVDKVVCATDTTLNCIWNAQKKKCITSSH